MLFNREQSAARFVCGILIRIALDDGISQQSDIVMSIERSLYTIWCNIPDGEWDEQVNDSLFPFSHPC
jgi:hypothetical protein